MREECLLICAYFKLIISKVAELVTGGVIAAGVAIYEHKTGSGISMDSALWGIAAFFLVAGFSAWREEFKKRTHLESVLSPRIILQFDASPLCLHESDDNTGGVIRRTLWVRVRVTSSKPLTGCRATLSTIDIWNNQQWQRTENFSGSQFLHWSNAGLQAISIAPGDEQFAQIIGIRRDDARVDISGFNADLRSVALLNTPGHRFRFNVTVSADNAPQEHVEIAFEKGLTWSAPMTWRIS